MYEAGVGVVLTCITKQRTEQVDFFAKQVPFEAHLSSRQRISPSKQ